MSPAGRPPLVGRQQILDVTAQMLRANPERPPSLRQVADRLGVSSMALYHYFPSKAALLVAALSSATEELPRPCLPENPAERLVALTLLTADTYDAQPWVLEVVLTGQAVVAPAMWVLDEVFATGHQLGLDDDDTSALWQILWRLIVGDLLMRQISRRRQAQEEGWMSGLDDDTLSALPHLRDARPALARSLPAHDLAHDVRLVVEATLRSAASGQRRPTR